MKQREWTILFLSFILGGPVLVMIFTYMLASGLGVSPMPIGGTLFVIFLIALFALVYLHSKDPDVKSQNF